MILGHDKIISEHEAGHIIIDPFNINLVGPNSYDLHLGNNLKKVLTNDGEPFSCFLNPTRNQKFLEVNLKDDGKMAIINPGELWLGHTIERAGSDYYVPMIEGRSSIARMGLSIHTSAGFGDVGFKDQWTLEITCTIPIAIYAGMRIAQVYFVHVSDNLPKNRYNGHYSGQQGAVESRFSD